MAQTAKTKFTSPAGRAQYPWLNEPDNAFGGEPKYKTNLIVEDSQKLMELINKIAEDNFGSKASKASMPYDTDEDTGETVFKVKSKYAPSFFDAQGKNLVGKQVPKIWGGSTIRVGGIIAPWTVSGSSGVSLQLTRVQVIDLVTSESGGEGFDAVEGSFVGDDIMQEAFDAPIPEQVQQTATAADRF